MQVADWLRTIGLEQYAAAFEQNAVGFDLLPTLTADDLKDLGVALVGHRRRILDAIAALRDGGGGAPAPPKPQAAGPAAAMAERRQLTVMFCDLVGSTALSARLDPEDLRGIIGAYHHCCAEVIGRAGGFVAKYMGDGVLAYFGYPEAHEDDAERAVRAGLALVEAVGALAPHPGPLPGGEGAAADFPSPSGRGQGEGRLQTRIGIATGLVVVGEVIGEGAAQEQAVVGETPNLAARLQALAEPGTVVIDAATRRLTGGFFEYAELGAVALKGFAAPVAAARVLREGAAEGRFEALRAASTPFVGRDEELALLERRWQQAKAGEGCVVLISGEPGIGKSRLAQVLLERLGTEPHTRLRCFCSPHHQDSALYPTIAQLEHAAGFRRDDTAAQRLDKLEALLAQATNDLTEAAPLIAELLSIPTADRYPALDLTPQKRKEKTLRALLAQVEGLAVRQPVLMLFEDAHWCDPTSLELLDLIVDRAPALPRLLIVTYRQAPTYSAFAPPWAGRPHVSMISLNRLPRQQRADMIAGVTSGKALPTEIAEQIVERTDGVPLFVEELTKAVVESGMLTDAGDRYTAAGPMPVLAIPATLHASLLARLDRLAPVREVAQIGAALGRQFSHELISAVAAMPQRQVDDALAQLVGAELIYRRGTPPDAEYTFKHALVQDAAYSTLLRSRRQQIHARITATLERQFPEIVAFEPAVLARHCAEAGLGEKAVAYWLKAGQQALARSATVEAVAHLRKGLDALAGLPNGLWRRQQELDLQTALGSALTATKGFAAAEVGATIARARTLAEQFDRPEYLVPLSMGQWQFHFVRSEHKLALALAEQLEKIGEARNDWATELLGRIAHGESCFLLGEFVAARAVQERSIGLSDQVYRTIGAGLSFDPYAAILAHLARTLACLGYIDQARSRMDEALSEARRLRHAHTLACLLSWACWMDSITCSPDLQKHAEEVLALSTEHGFTFFLGWAKAQRGRSMTVLGQAQEGVALLTEGLAAASANGAVITTPTLLTWLAEAYAMLGQPLEGLNCLAKAAQIIEATEERVEEADLHRVRGDLLNVTGDRSAAEQNYRQALAVAKRQSAKLFELRAANSLGRLWRDQGRRRDAHALLAPVYGWFTEGFDAPDLVDAKALLVELREPVSVAPAPAS